MERKGPLPCSQPLIAGLYRKECVHVRGSVYANELVLYGDGLLTAPNPNAGGPSFVGCPPLII
jgi:hypothetical protein